MTGQVIVEFDGRAIPKVTFRGEIIPINVRMLDRFIRVAYRKYCYELQKASARAKLAKLTKSDTPEAPKTMLPTDVVEEVKEATNLKKVNATQTLSEDKKDDQKRDAGDAKGPGRSEGIEKAGIGGAGRSITGHICRG